MRRRVLAIVLAVLAGCAGAPDAPPGVVRGEVVVSAAASLTEVFAEVAADLERQHEGLTVRLNLAGSPTLVAQVAGGAPVDVLATAAVAPMDRAVATGRVEAGDVVAFAVNRLVIAVEAGNPQAVGGLRDLTRDDLVVVLADPAVPAGALAEQVLDAAGVTLRPASLEVDVRAALGKVALGEADVALVFATDVGAAGGRVDAVPIDGVDAVTTYQVAVLTDAPNPTAAAAFVAVLLGEVGVAHLAAAGFGSVEEAGP